MTAWHFPMSCHKNNVYVSKSRFFLAAEGTKQQEDQPKHTRDEDLHIEDSFKPEHHHQREMPEMDSSETKGAGITATRPGKSNAQPSLRFQLSAAAS